MSEKTLEILRKHEGKKGYRWYLEVGMDTIEALKDAMEDGDSPKDVEDLSDNLIGILADCSPSLGVSLLYILMRHHYISFHTLIGEDDIRKAGLADKYRAIFKAVIGVQT